MRQTVRKDHSEVQSNVLEGGFTLLEMVIAIVVLFIAIAGVFAAVGYAVNLNTGNSQRSQSLSVLQREIELMRNAKFTPAVVSPGALAVPTTINCADPDNGIRDITGGAKPIQLRYGADCSAYRVQTTVDDDPFTDGVQINPTLTAPQLKEIEIIVTPMGAKGLWETGRQTRMILRRVRSN
jgi:type II secretory pathway pseudopilin PulG